MSEKKQEPKSEWKPGMPLKFKSDSTQDFNDISEPTTPRRSTRLRNK